MDRLKIFVLNSLSPKDGIYNTFIDIPSMMNFFQRMRGNTLHRFNILAVKGKKSMFIEKIDPLTLTRNLNEFIIQR